MNANVDAAGTEIGMGCGFGHRPPARGSGSSAAVVIIGVVGLLLPGLAVAQQADRVILLTGTPVSGKVLAVSPLAVDVENSQGETQKVPIESIREVQFGAESDLQSLRSARSMLLRGRGVDAREEIAKVGADDIPADEPLVAAEVEFVRAAAAGRAALEAGGDVAAAAKTVADYLTKHAKSHHFFQMQELLGDLEARAGRPEQALAAYRQLDAGPAAMKVRSAAVKAAMLLAQGNVDEASKEYDAAIKLAGNEKSSAPQRRAAELGKARCMALQGKQEDGVKLVDQIIKNSDPEEKELLARAYTVLGVAYRSMAGREQDALIQFLMVDLVYNTLPESHAESLFNLVELWEKGGNAERAREARASLESTYPASSWAAKLKAGKS
ncbi:MAG: hypothetical protein ACKOTB_16875 [Planctomycetia bacterium]